MTDAVRPIPTTIEGPRPLDDTPSLGAPPRGGAPPLGVVAGSAKAASAEPLHVMRKLTGRGDVLDGTRVVADVDYALRDIEERGAIHAPPTVDVTGSPAYRRNVYGLVTCPDPGALADYLGAPLVLHLEDNTRLHITIAKVLGPFRYLVQALDAVGASGSESKGSEST